MSLKLFRRSYLINLCFLILSITSAFLAAELACRMLFSPAKIVTSNGIVGDSATVNIVGSQTAEANKVIESNLYLSTAHGLRMRPNAQVSIKNHPLSHLDVTIRTDSFGFRGGESGSKKGERVLMIGDSITMADYLPEELTIPALLKNKLPATTDVFNAAVVGLGTNDEYYVLKESLSAVMPDKVVLMFYLNDARSSPTYHLYSTPNFLNWSSFAGQIAMTFSVLESKILGEQDAISSQLLNSWYNETKSGLHPQSGDPLQSAAAFDQLILDNFEDWGTAWSGGAWSEIKSNLNNIASLCKESGVKLYIVAWPVRYQVEAQFVNDFPQRQLQLWAQQQDLPMFDVLPALRSLWQQSHEPLFYDHCHPTERANREVAEKIAELIQ